jgi:competence protein ComEC
MIGIGVSYIKIDTTHDVYSGVVSEVSNNYFLFNSNFENFYIYEKNNSREIGDILDITGTKENLDFVTLEHQFNFSSFLKNKGIYYSLKADKINVKFSNPIRLNEAKESFIDTLPEEAKSLASAILFSSLDDSETIVKFKELNIVRLCLSSGIYLSFYFLIIKKLFAIKMKEKTARIMSLIVLIPYLVIIFPKFAALKMLIIFILKFINDFAIKKKFDYLEIISLSGLILFLFNINYAKQDSFILSYFITFFVYFINNSFKHFNGLKRKILIVLSIFIILIPYSFKANNSVFLLEPLVQLLITPIISVFGLASLLTFYKIPLNFCLAFFASLIDNSLDIITIFNIQIHGPEMNSILLILYEITIFIVTYLFSLKIKRIRFILPIPFILFMTLYTLPIDHLFTSEVSFINVGQGDSVFIRSGGVTALIDTGGSKYIDIAKECLIPYFESKRIYKIDYLIITHDDFDHSGAADSLIDNFEVCNYIKTNDAFPISLGGTTLYSLNNDYADNDNDSSLVIKFKISKTSFLLTGDISTKKEKMLINSNTDINADILKVSHHGSNTATSADFIKKVSPLEAVISVGKNNSYGHPHQNVISLLNKYHVKIRRTDMEGTITYVF